MKLTLKTIELLLQRVRFDMFSQDFHFRAMSKGGGFLIQVGCEMMCVEKGEVLPQWGGKHYISPHATHGEVILKAFKACKDFVNHELHEAFYVDGVRLFDPHVDIDSLVDALKYMKRTSRDGSWTPQHTMENV